MRQITKGQEPASLVEHRTAAHCDYDNYAAKDDLRASLATEQRGLCCYCTGRIRTDSKSMKIEHWRCQSGHPEVQLVYRNILGACMGSEGQPRTLQHCDTHKGDDDLKWNPAEPLHRIEDRIIYELDGTVRSSDTVFNGQLNDVLNLNVARLKNNRAGVLTGVLEWWKQSRPVSIERLETEVRRHSGAAGNGDMEPYSAVAAWWLRRKLEKAVT